MTEFVFVSLAQKIEENRARMNCIWDIFSPAQNKEGICLNYFKTDKDLYTKSLYETGSML